MKNDIKIIPTWIPRAEKFLADFYSKIDDADDWSIDKKSFQKNCNNFANVAIDRFASNSNKKEKKFNSKYYCPEINGVNSFTKDWSATIARRSIGCAHGYT